MLVLLTTMRLQTISSKIMIPTWRTINSLPEQGIRTE